MNLESFVLRTCSGYCQCKLTYFSAQRMKPLSGINCVYSIEFTLTKDLGSCRATGTSNGGFVRQGPLASHTQRSLLNLDSK